MGFLAVLLSKLRPEKPSNQLVGHIDGIFSGSMRGWIDGGKATPVSLIVKKNGTVLGKCVANQFRVDLMEKGVRDGRCGFSLPLLKEPDIRIGDVIEMVDALAPRRKLTLRMNRRTFNRALGAVERVEPNRVAGWVYLPWQPKRSARVEIRLGRRVIGAGVADLYRGHNSGVGAARCGFEIEFDSTRDVLAGNAGLSVVCVDSARALQNPDSVVTATAPLGSRLGSAVGSAAATTGDSCNPREDLEQENQRLRSAMAGCRAEITLNRLQLLQVQEEMEHWFVQYLKLEESCRQVTSLNPGDTRPNKRDG